MYFIGITFLFKTRLVKTSLRIAARTGFEIGLIKDYITLIMVFNFIKCIFIVIILWEWVHNNTYIIEIIEMI
jgi:hypothetical protein